MAEPSREAYADAVLEAAAVEVDIRAGQWAYMANLKDERMRAIGKTIQAEHEASAMTIRSFKSTGEPLETVQGQRLAEIERLSGLWSGTESILRSRMKLIHRLAAEEPTDG